jgi:hypothetical protein
MSDLAQDLIDQYPELSEEIICADRAFFEIYHKSKAKYDGEELAKHMFLSGYYLALLAYDTRAKMEAQWNP